MPAVSGSAVRGKDGKVHVGLSNLDPTQPNTVTVKLDGLTAGTVSGRVLTANAMNAHNTFEAPFIIDHGGYYWLMASYDYCCKGVNSTYYTVIGRSKDITGPYLGKDGSAMMEGGGTIFLRADLQEQQRFRGPGHAGWLHDKDGKDYVVYHAYDKQADGAPTLRIAPVRWGADGWPVADY